MEYSSDKTGVINTSLPNPSPPAPPPPPRTAEPMVGECTLRVRAYTQVQGLGVVRGGGSKVRRKKYGGGAGCIHTLGSGVTGPKFGMKSKVVNHAR